MKKFLCTALLLAAGVLPVQAATICISTRDIVDSQPQDDGKAILFKMRDGSTWRNDLQGACPDLKFDGFAWTIRDPDEQVCEHQQSLRVLRSGQICVLGKFTQTKAPKKPM
jgi:hypothetical protein